MWKNKIRVRHASLGELRHTQTLTQKKNPQCKLDNNQSRHASCFHTDTNQVKSSQTLSNKERQITAWPVVLEEKIL